MSQSKDSLNIKINIDMSSKQSEPMTAILASLKHNYALILKTSSNSELKQILDQLDDDYYNNGKTWVSDVVYDAISDYYYSKVGGNKSSKTGHKVDSISKVKLPFVCTSLDKVKPGQSKLSSFFKKYTDNKFVSSKLDGNSLLIGREFGQPKAWTRGDGTFGQDVSHILHYLKGSDGKTLAESVTINFEDGYYVRGEIIISKKNWEENSHLGSNARNVVAGLIHNKTLTSDHIYSLENLVDFLGYEVIVRDGKKITRLGTIENQFQFIQTSGILTPMFKIYSDLSETVLPEVLKTFKEKSSYEIDGIVIENNSVNDRYTSGNPKYAKAFKMDMYNDSGIAKVIGIDWTMTKAYTFKPTIMIEPTIINQVEIARVYAYNARYLLDNKIGKGTTLEVIRSGDVIPKVKTVIQSKFNISSDFPQDDYEWDGDSANAIDIKFSGGFSEEAKKRQIEHFIKTTGIEFIKQGTIKKLYDIGFVTIKDYINLQSASEFTKAEGIKAKSANKMYNSVISVLQNLEESIFAAALPSFNGIGKKRMKIIMDNIPNFLTLDKDTIFNQIINLDGFSDKMADLFINGLDNYKEYRNVFIQKMDEFKSIEPETNTSTSTLFKDCVFCFSGVRSKDTEKLIVDNGGTISGSVNKKTTHLIVKDKTATSGKITKANGLGIKVINLDEFSLIV